MNRRDLYWRNHGCRPVLYPPFKSTTRPFHSCHIHLWSNRSHTDVRHGHEASKSAAVRLPREEGKDTYCIYIKHTHTHTHTPWWFLVSPEWDAPVVVFCRWYTVVRISVHQLSVLKGYRQPVFRIIPILCHASTLCDQSNTVRTLPAYVTTAGSASRHVLHQRWRLTHVLICPLWRNSGQFPSLPVTYIKHLHGSGRRGEFVVSGELAQWWLMERKPCSFNGELGALVYRSREEANALGCGQ